MDTKFEVVISGVSGKFPECNDVPSFKDALYQENALVTLRDERWPIKYNYKYSNSAPPAATGKVKSVKEIDIGVFKISSAIAECTSVSNRVTMEPAFEAIMDAGINPHQLAGRCIGVYTASDHCDSDTNFIDAGEGKRLWVLGCCKAMMSNRISFAFDLTGPSMTFLHDLNGSFLALNEAYKMISEGYIDAAVVGVASTALYPSFSMNLMAMNVLSVDSVTRVFDKNASGYGRSDAFVALYLQRAEDAKRVYATIDFSGYTYYGSNPNSLLGYDEKLLKKCMLDMYSEKNYKGYNKDVGFVEMNACGLKRTDRIECNAIAEILHDGGKTPLLVGSVKSNTGNTEGAGPYVGLIKAILAMETGSILHNINLQQIDDDIEALADNKLKIVTKLTPLQADKIAVNSVGIGGSFSQVIVKRNPRTKGTNEVPVDNLPRLVLICGRTEDGTSNAIKKLEQKQFDTNFISLVNDVFCTDMPFHTFRGYTILSADRSRTKKNALSVKGNRNRPVWFLFSGMGSQWNLMGNGLLDIPIFAETVRKCDDILKPKGIDIYYILTNNDRTIFDNIVHAFVGIITVQIGLVEILKALGIKADGIIGHSVGENACAYADGCLTLEQAVLSSHARGLASIETETIKGMMAAIGKGYDEIKDSLPPNIEVACHNSASSCTLSGPADDISEFVQRLQEEKVFAKAVNVANIAYHSKYIAPAAPNLLSRLQKVIPTPIERSSKWVSTSIPETNWDQPLAKCCSAEYLTNNLLSSVLFEEGCKRIPSDALVIEIAPHGLLQAILKRSLPNTCANVSLTRRNNENKNLDNILAAIGELYIAGCDVNVNAIYPSIQYPVPRDTPSVAPFAVWSHSSFEAGASNFNKVGSCSNDPITISVSDDSPYSYLKYHRINDQIILPTSFFLYIIWWAFSVQSKQDLGTKPIVFEDIHLFKNVRISLKKTQSFLVLIQKGSGMFEILKRSNTDEYKSTTVMTGVIIQAENDFEIEKSQSEIPKKIHAATGEQFYNLFQNVGYRLEDTFRGIQELAYIEKDYCAKMKWNNNWVSFLDMMLKFSMFRQMKDKADLMYTKRIRKIEILPSAIQSMEEGSTLLCHQNFLTNEITCDGVLIHGIQNDSYTDTRDKPNIKLEGLRFISHGNPKCQSVAEFLNVCLQIAYDSTVTMTKSNNPKLNVVVKNNESIVTSLKAIVKSSSSLKSRVEFWKPKEVLSHECSGANDCYLVVTNDLRDTQRYSAKSQFLLIITSDCQSVNAESMEPYEEITKQRFADTSITLYKRRLTTVECKSRIFLNNGDRQELDKSETAFMITSNTNFENLSLMLIDNKHPIDHRYIFVMDEQIPNDTTLETQFAQNLPISVMQNGEWGSYRAVLEEPQEKNERSKRVRDLLLDIQLQSIQLRYLSSDAKEEMEDNACKYGIEYSGLHVSGEKVMGLSLISTFEPITEPDSILMWKVPETWSLEDAATVPFIYAYAYNILILVRGKQFTHNVLINVGNEGLLALACISLSLQKKYIVYVSVSNEQEAAFIRKKFPQIKPSQIFNRQIHNYEIEILTVTKSEGVDLVINCVPGIEHVISGLNCVAETGHAHYIEVADLDDVEFHRLGLKPFMKSVSFVAVPNKISTLLKLSNDYKRQLQAYVQEGIETGIVVPFERNVRMYGLSECFDEFEEQNFTKTVYKFTQQNELGYQMNPRIRYDDNHSYIIVGGEKKDISWFELVEWLIVKGARKFIIAIDNFFVGPKISHQMNRLLNQKKATIILTSSQKVESVEDAIQLVDEANNVAPLEAIFFISVQSAGKKIRNIDLATQQNHPSVHFVSIFSGGLKECEIRRYKGSPAVVIHGKRPSKKLSTILPHVGNLLEKFDNSNSPTLYRLIDEKYEDTKVNNFAIRNYLPPDIFYTDSIGRDLAKDTEFVEVATLTPRFSDGKNTTPIFVISTLGPKPLQGLFRNLFSPAFCAVITNSVNSISQAAFQLYESLNRIQSREGVTLIAETWLSCVALEMTRLLQRDGRKYQLFTIEGNPLVWKERIKALGPIDSPQFENYLITQAFGNNNNKSVVYDNFNPSQPLADKICAYLLARNYPSHDVRYLVTVIDTIRNGLILASEYRHDEKELVKNTIALSQRTPTDDKMMNLSVSSEIFVHKEDNYYAFINSRNVLRKINDNILYNRWYEKECEI